MSRTWRLPDTQNFPVHIGGWAAPGIEVGERGGTGWGGVEGWGENADNCN